MCLRDDHPKLTGFARFCEDPVALAAPVTVPDTDGGTYKTGGAFADYKAPPAEVLQWQQSSIGRYLPVRESLNEEQACKPSWHTHHPHPARILILIPGLQVSSLRTGLQGAISKLDAASSALYKKMRLETVEEGISEEEASAWVAEVEAARDKVADAEADAIACITGVTSTVQAIEVLTRQP